MRLSTGGVVSQHALQAVSQHALQQVSRGVPALGGCLLPGGGACSWGVPAPGGCGGDPPDQQTATVADGMHPTGMQSCLTLLLCYQLILDLDSTKINSRDRKPSHMHT